MQQMVKFIDFYKLLGIRPSANAIQIRQAFLKKSKQHHPDVGGSTETMRLLNEAYNTLSDASPKAAYDLIHSFKTGTKDIVYQKIEPAIDNETSSENLPDEYIDWFLDSVYNEYANINKPKPTIGSYIKKVFNTYF